MKTKVYLKNIFLLPCLPYHLSVFFYLIYLSFKENDLHEMIIGNINRNKKFDDFIEKFDKDTMPIQVAYCAIFWLWLFLKLF